MQPVLLASRTAQLVPPAVPLKSSHPPSPPAHSIPCSGNDDDLPCQSNTAANGAFGISVPFEADTYYYLAIGNMSTENQPTLLLSVWSAPRPPPPPRCVHGTGAAGAVVDQPVCQLARPLHGCRHCPCKQAPLLGCSSAH
jgi:hypothetical protein